MSTSNAAAESDPSFLAVLEAKKDALRETEIVYEPRRPLEPGEARLTIDRIAYTANTLTYGVFGGPIGYWGFFPASRPDWGRIPAWGYARVEESRAPGLAEGELIYGFLPMGESLVVTPGAVSARGFSDQAAHRAPLHAIYNGYLRVAADPGFAIGDPDLQPIFRPLFTTGFLLDAFIAEHSAFGAVDVLVTSASSKTAIGMAHVMAARAKETSGQPRRVALTSARNLSFVRELGVYDHCMTYDDVGALDPARRAMIIDFAGDGALIGAMNAQLGEAVVHNAMIGKSHWDAGGLPSDMKGVRPTLFFAPDHARRLMSEWGPAGFTERFGARWAPFLTDAAGWVDIRRGRGLEEVARVHAAFLGGAVDARAGHIINLGR